MQSTALGGNEQPSLVPTSEKSNNRWEQIVGLLFDYAVVVRRRGTRLTPSCSAALRITGGYIIRLLRSRPRTMESSSAYVELS